MDMGNNYPERLATWTIIWLLLPKDAVTTLIEMTNLKTHTKKHTHPDKQTKDHNSIKQYCIHDIVGFISVLSLR